MSHSVTIPAAVRRAVTQRAENRCEYCQLSQIGQEATFHIDHIVPLNERGSTELENLALACQGCNNYKAAKIVANDPGTNTLTALFHPRQQSWAEHFAWSEDGLQVIGLTATGRATVLLLRTPVTVLESAKSKASNSSGNALRKTGQ